MEKSKKVWGWVKADGTMQVHMLMLWPGRYRLIGENYGDSNKNWESGTFTEIEQGYDILMTMHGDIPTTCHESLRKWINSDRLSELLKGSEWKPPATCLPRRRMRIRRKR